MPKKAPFSSIAEAQRIAESRLPSSVATALKGGKERGVTLDDNIDAFDELGFSPTVFERPTSFELNTTLMGVELDFPVVASPLGAAGIHPDGEVGVAHATAALGTAIGLSSMGNASIKDVVAANPKAFFQLYWSGDRALIAERVQAAAAAGARGLIVTLDMSHNYRKDWTGPVALPRALTFRSALGLAPQAFSRPTWFAQYLRRGRIPSFAAPNLFTPGQPPPTMGVVWEEYNRTPTPTVADIEWLRGEWDGPMMIKGVNTLRDANIAAELGVDAISVSNHGGNNIDGSVSPLRYLPHIVEVVDGRMQVVMDGGIRRGADVAKALALGADAVFVGRAWAYSLAAAGESGVRTAFQILRDGLRETLFGIGRSSIHELSSADLLIRNPNFFVPPAR